MKLDEDVEMKDDSLRQSLTGKKAFNIWELLASVSADLLSLVDRNYIYRAVNDSYLRAYNRSREEIVGHSARDLLGSEIFDKFVKNFFDRCLAGEEIRYQSWFNYPTLGRRFMDIFYHPYSDTEGTIAGVFADIHDITDLQAAREALRQSEEKYRTILEDMEDSYFEVDLAGNLTFANDATCRHLRYSRQELIGLNYKDFTAAEDVETVYRAFNKVYRTDKPVHSLVWKIARKGIGEGFAEAAIFPLRNEGGEVTGFRGVGRDVTERIQAQEALQTEKNKLQSLISAMEDGLTIRDTDYNLIYQNEPSMLTSGGNRVGEKCYRALEGREKVCPGCPAEKAFRDGKSHTSERRVALPSGEVIFWENTASPIRDAEGKIVACLEIGKNVTERKKSEEALKQSEERYRTVLDQMEESYYEVDIAGNFTFFNDAMCRQLGYSRDELMGMNYRAITPPENVKKVFRIYNQVYRSGKPVTSVPIERIRKDRTLLSVESSIIPSRNDDGKIIGFRGIARDISARKKAEEEKRQMEQKTQLASRLACVGELASGVAHEINNPLTGVIGYAHLLLDRDDISQDIRHDLEIINEGAQRVAGIVRKLLTFARQQKPEQKLADINEIISTTLDLRAYELASNNIKVDFQPACDLPMTIVDPGQLQQMFLNLIINAETEMKLSHGKGKLSIKTEHIDNIIRISFKDNGPGIAKENLEKIFDPFFTTREVGQGTGLGLNLCHGIITEHRGRIWAESKPGKGATFFVELPVVTQDRQSALPPAKEPEKVTRAKILVIDDEPLVRQLASRVLSEEGHEVESVGNAKDALKRIKNKRYSRIMLDIKMPGMNGINLYEQLQEIAPSLKKRVVFVTGDAMGKHTTDFLSKTKAPYITKPFEAEQLKMEINRILARG